jgi:hypothetical protein
LWQDGQPLRKKSRIVVEPFGKLTRCTLPWMSAASNSGWTAPTEGAGGGPTGVWARAPAGRAKAAIRATATTDDRLDDTLM